jgi:hypothetical protein
MHPTYSKLELGYGLAAKNIPEHISSKFGGGASVVVVVVEVVVLVDVDGSTVMFP